MKLHLVLLAACTLLSSPAVSQSITEKTGVNAAVGAAPSTQDFVTQAAVSDMFELESSKLAQSIAQDPGIKTFAAKMVKDHTQTSAELKGLISAGKIKAELPKELDSAHKGKLDKLKALKGADFDKQYDSEQEAAHKNAVSLFERYAKGGENAELKAFAAKHLPHLQEHLKLAQEMGNKGTTGSK
jgi:putative membrane protein